MFPSPALRFPQVVCVAVVCRQVKNATLMEYHGNGRGASRLYTKALLLLDYLARRGSHLNSQDRASIKESALWQGGMDILLLFFCTVVQNGGRLCVFVHSQNNLMKSLKCVHMCERFNFVRIHISLCACGKRVLQEFPNPL